MAIHREGKRQYHAFTIYRDMGVGRSYRKTAIEVGASLPSVCTWAKKYDWQGRLNEYQKDVAERQEGGALVKIDDPVIKKMTTMLEQAEALIDSAFSIDRITGRPTPKIKIEKVEDLTKLIREYRQMLDSYNSFLTEHKPRTRDDKKASNIEQFNIYMGNASQEDRIKMLEEIKNGNAAGGDRQPEGGFQDADYTEVSEPGDEN